MSRDHCIDPNNKAVYSEALEVLIDSGVPFVIGGAFAVHFYTDLWRDTRDMDVFVTPENVQPAIDALLGAGFANYGEMAAGDNEWIFHGRKRDIMVDVIWKFANRITVIGQEWIDEAERGEFLGYPVAFAPLEELIYSKLFTLNRHRCDWPDIIRLIQNDVRPVQWDHLLRMVGEHWLLLAGLIDVFDWELPPKMDLVPEHIRRELRRRREQYHPEPGLVSREELLDPWVHTRKEDVCVSGL
ncbi:MAG: nucleotidyltransferase [Armatimonadota bacterium]|nr:nucleotidyltransferase [Armatimonadota bacterium]